MDSLNARVADGPLPSRAPVLIVEDRDSLRMMLRRALESAGHAVCEASDEPGAVEVLRTTSLAAVLTDLKLPRGDGLGVLRASKSADPDIAVIVMTAYGSIQDAVTAMKEGALDFLAKPVDPDHLLLLVNRVVAQRRLLNEYLLLKEESTLRRGLPEILGESPALAQALGTLRRAAGADSTVLLEGESGTGKELFARALHALGSRGSGPFVAINCAAIPEALLEAELFGYERGAFTGAGARKVGRFELADGGTLFLDEIGDLPLPLQAKILRALERREFERLGGTATIHVDVRVVAATNRNLRAAVAARLFREDLFFRLSVYPILIPPLRQRQNDIVVLARHFVERYCREMNKPAIRLAPAAEDALLRYAWPGNVRELQNCMERAVILADDDRILAHHLNLVAPLLGPTPTTTYDPWNDIDLSGTMADATRKAVAEVERRKLLRALREAGGDPGRAADALRISFKTVMTKIRDYQIDLAAMRE